LYLAYAWISFGNNAGRYYYSFGYRISTTFLLLWPSAGHTERRVFVLKQRINWITVIKICTYLKQQTFDKHVRKIRLYNVRSTWKSSRELTKKLPRQRCIRFEQHYWMASRIPVTGLQMTSIFPVSERFRCVVISNAIIIIIMIFNGCDRVCITVICWPVLYVCVHCYTSECQIVRDIYPIVQDEHFKFSSFLTILIYKQVNLNVHFTIK
jgi:hypothetical protein